MKCPSYTPEITTDVFEALKFYRRALNIELFMTLERRIKPIVTVDEQDYYIEHRPRDAFNRVTHVGKPAGDLEEVGRILTLHEFTVAEIFTPKICDVLSMIPPHAVSRVSAFRTLEVDTDKLIRQSAALKERFHVAQTILYH